MGEEFGRGGLVGPCVWLWLRLRSLVLGERGAVLSVIGAAGPPPTALCSFLGAESHLIHPTQSFWGVLYICILLGVQWGLTTWYTTISPNHTHMLLQVCD